MGAYRYIVFPKHQQPSVGEAVEFESYSPLLKGRWSIGRARKTAALAMLFDAEVFEQAMTNEGFELLIRRWQTRGCELVDKLKFVKDSSAFKPTPTQIRERQLSPDKILAAKKYLADEAVARSLLGVKRTLERITWLERVGKAVPYAIIALGTLGLLVTGFYIHSRLENTARERRADAIERLASDTKHPRNDVHAENRQAENVQPENHEPMDPSQSSSDVGAARR